VRILAARFGRRDQSAKIATSKSRLFLIATRKGKAGLCGTKMAQKQNGANVHCTSAPGLEIKKSPMNDDACVL